MQAPPIPKTAPAAASAPPSAPPPAPEAPSAAETLFSGVQNLWRDLTRLEPAEVIVNLGLSLLVVALVAVAVIVLRRLLDAGLRSLGARGKAVKGHNKVAKFTWGLVRLLAVLAALAAILMVWGVDVVAWFATGLGASVLRIAVTILVAVGLIEVAGLVVNRLLVVVARKTGAGRRAAQVKTLAPLIKGVVQAFVIAIASLTVLSELGVEIGPLLASAGVVGIAVGFGAQTLVKDFLTGIFMIVEDMVAVGDNIRVGDRSGTVESMSLRTLRIRSMNGTLHILPFSEAQVIDNRTKGFSAYVFDLGIGYDDDIDKAFEVMKRVGEELQADPTYGPMIEQPLEILGVDALAESAVMLKAKFRTRPGMQWKVGRAYNKRIKEAFDAAGIEIPYRKLVVEAGQAIPIAAIDDEAPAREGEQPGNERE